MKDSLGDRMKQYYEDRYRTYLTRRTPVILRLDGKSFHTLTKQCEKPFDLEFINAMYMTAKYLVKNIQGAVVAYVQSDEISLFLRDYDLLRTEAWFDYNVQKMVSVAASMASVQFSQTSKWGNGYFDCRAFNIPKEEVTNYFIWRQLDWQRNSLNMFAQSCFSHKELQGKSQNDVIDMLQEKGWDWSGLPEYQRNGIFARLANREVYSWFGVLKERRDFIESLVLYDN